MGKLIHELVTDNNVAREIMNGTWFILSGYMLCAFSLYLLHTWREEPMTKSMYVWIEPTRWYYRPDVRLAIALTIYMFGSWSRAGYIWYLLECQNRTMSSCKYILDNYEVLLASSLAAMLGGLCSIRLLVPERWYPNVFWIVAGITAVAIPIAIHIIW